MSTLGMAGWLRQVVRSPLYANAIYLMAANASNAVLGFVFWLIAARLYAAEDVGLASATVSAGGFLSMAATLGLGYGLIRFIPSAGRNSARMINASLTLGTLTAVAAAGIFVAGLGFWSPALKHLQAAPSYLLAFTFLVLLSVLSEVVNETLVGRRRAGFVFAKTVVYNAVRLPALALLAGSLLSLGIVVSWVAALAISLVLAFVLFLPRALPGYRPFFTFSREHLAPLLRFSVANYVSLLLWSAPAMLLPVMVVNVLGAEPNAYFYVAWAIGNTIGMIPTGVSMSLFAEGSHEEAGLGRDLGRSVKMVAILLVPALVLILLLAGPILSLFGHAYSEAATTLVRILALCSLPFAINIIYLGSKRVEKRLLPIVGLPALIAAVTLGLAYYLLPRAGISGAGLAWLIGQSAAAVLVLASWLRSVRRKRPAISPPA